MELDVKNILASNELSNNKLLNQFTNIAPKPDTKRNNLYLEKNML